MIGHLEADGVELLLEDVTLLGHAVMFAAGDHHGDGRAVTRRVAGAWASSCFGHRRVVGVEVGDRRVVAGGVVGERLGGDLALAVVHDLVDPARSMAYSTALRTRRLLNGG